MSIVGVLLEFFATKTNAETLLILSVFSGNNGFHELEKES